MPTAIQLASVSTTKGKTQELIVILVADPDRSNPTRSRWERPLDTIRAFEAAIDGSYSRKPYSRAGESRSWSTLLTPPYSTVLTITESVYSGAGYNRRSSYYGGRCLVLFYFVPQVRSHHECDVNALLNFIIFLILIPFNSSPPKVV